MMHPYKLRHAALTIAIDRMTFTFLMIPPFRGLRLMTPPTIPTTLGFSIEASIGKACSVVNRKPRVNDSSWLVNVQTLIMDSAEL